MPLPKLSRNAKHALELADAERSLVEGLVRVRKESGLRGSDVAARLGRNKSAVSRFESLDGDPRLSTVFRYALAVGARVTVKVEPYSDWAAHPSTQGGHITVKTSGWTGDFELLEPRARDHDHA